MMEKYLLGRPSLCIKLSLDLKVFFSNKGYFSEICLENYPSIFVRLKTFFNTQQV